MKPVTREQVQDRRGLIHLLSALIVVSALTARLGADVPLELNHQGVVSVNGLRFEGTGAFRFSLVDIDTGNYLWTNDGSSPTPPAAPTNGVNLSVTAGVYSIRLGNTSLANMVSIPSAVFNNDNVSLRIWFNDGVNGVQLLAPDHPLTTSPYSFRTATADYASTAGPGAGAIPGEIRMWAGPEGTIPNGWQLCDGSQLVRADYPELFAAIGTSWGNGNGTTTFHVPDLQGRFVRGVNRSAPGAQGDPDAASRVASNAGGNTGNAVGSLQLDATAMPNSTFATQPNGSHSHSGDAGNSGGAGAARPLVGFNPAAASYNTDAVGNHSHTITGGDNETRPVNAYVHYIIKL